MKVTLRLVIVFLLLVSAGCTLTKSSVVRSSGNPFINTGEEIKPFNVGIVIDNAFINQSVRTVTQQEALKYDFEFRLGEDISRTMPLYIEKLYSHVTVLERMENRDDLDFILVPDISSSKAMVWLRMSAAPSYELSINLKVMIIKNAKIYNILNITESTTNDIPALSNEDEVRTNLMKEAYEQQLSKIYLKLGNALNTTLFEVGKNFGRSELKILTDDPKILHNKALEIE